MKKGNETDLNEQGLCPRTPGFKMKKADHWSLKGSGRSPLPLAYRLRLSPFGLPDGEACKVRILRIHSVSPRLSPKRNEADRGFAPVPPDLKRKKQTIGLRREAEEVRFP